MKFTVLALTGLLEYGPGLIEAQCVSWRSGAHFNFWWDFSFFQDRTTSSISFSYTGSGTSLCCSSLDLWDSNSSAMAQPLIKKDDDRDDEGPLLFPLPRMPFIYAHNYSISSLLVSILLNSSISSFRIAGSVSKMLDLFVFVVWIQLLMCSVVGLCSN